jgi:hypothetical protein
MLPRIIQLTLLVILVTSLAACADQSADPNPAAENNYIPVIAASELVVGQNRLPLGILDNGTPVNDPELQLDLRLFYLDGGEPDQVQSEVTAVYRGQGLPLGLYVAYADFDQPGGWAAEISIPQPSGDPQVQRMRLDVLPQPFAPGVGTPAIPSQNLTAADVPDLKQLTSDSNPDPDLYQLTIADALQSGKPFLVSFATPGYCQTAVCAPNMAVIKQLKAEYQSQVNFLHIEVYPYPYGESFQAQRRVPAMDEWRLRTEPWTFLVNAGGIIEARYEGGITLAELEPALAQLATGEPVDPSLP